MRLFFAIFPPKEIRDQMRDALRLYSKQKQNLVNLPVDQMHITLKYIGPKVSRNSFEIIDSYLEDLRNAQFPKPEIKFSKITFGFERETYPKLLIARIEENDKLVDLASIFHSYIRELKLRDTITWKKYSENTFHMTLSRLKASTAKSASKQLKEFTKNVEFEELGSFVPDYVYLVESENVEGKPNKYRKLEQIKL
jgi:2'-5' RNA ligase